MLIEDLQRKLDRYGEVLSRDYLRAGPAWYYRKEAVECILPAIVEVLLEAGVCTRAFPTFVRD